MSEQRYPESDYYFCEDESFLNDLDENLFNLDDLEPEMQNGVNLGGSCTSFNCASIFHENPFSPSDLLLGNSVKQLTSNEKTCIANKVQQMLLKKNTVSDLNQIPKISLDFEGQLFPSEKRVTIARQILFMLKKSFDKYNQKSKQDKVTFRTIAEELNLTMAEVKALYDEYIIDPNFTSRINKLESHDRTIQLPQVQKSQLLDEGHIHPSKTSMVSRNIRNRDSINDRYRYSRRYLELTQDKIADICFLGEYSYSNNFSLSSCPTSKRDTFVNHQAIKFPRKIKLAPKEQDQLSDKWGRNLQILVVISLNGIIHHSLYSNIFAECNFFNTLMTIGNTMQSRNPNHNKYLILETSFFHSKQDLRKFEGQTGIKVIFLPPHTPMLNPTEYLFNEMKQLVKSKSNKHHRTHADIVSELLETLKDKSMQGYYSCIRPYLQLALLQKPFK